VQSIRDLQNINKCDPHSLCEYTVGVLEEEKLTERLFEETIDENFINLLKKLGAGVSCLYS
jgi:hypothetical protein